MDNIPKAGNSLSRDDFDMLLEAIGQRQKNFPSEPAQLSMALVFFNIGNRFAPVTCIEGEWEGYKKDIPPGQGIPKCPNGHVLTEGSGLKLGWVSEVEDPVHNVPWANSDERTHIMNEDCWCLPKIAENGKLIIHRDDRKTEEN